MLVLAALGVAGCHRCEPPGTATSSQDLDVAEADFDAAVGDGAVEDACDELCASLDEELEGCSAGPLEAGSYVVTCVYTVQIYCE